MYGLAAAVTNKADQRRLDGFQAKCLRRILRIEHSFLSRVSNKDVLEQAGHQPLSARLAHKRECYLTELMLRSENDPVRNLVLNVDGSLRQVLGKRRVGRPRARWAQTIVEGLAT